MTAPAAAPKGEREKTGYVVLELNESSHSWKERGPGPYRAASAEAAIRAHLDRNPVDGKEFVNEGAGTYVAIPARSWKPVTVKTETKTVVTLS